MAEPTLSLTFRDLYLLAAEGIFGNRVPDQSQKEEAQRFVNAAYRDFLAEHDWSFLYPTATLAVTVDAAVAASGTIGIAAGNAADGNTITISDGVNTPTTFEFDHDASVTSGNVSVTIGGTATLSMTALISAINAASDLDVTATTSTPADGNCTLANDTAGFDGNQTITKVGGNITVAGMSGGLDEGTRETDLPDNFGSVLSDFQYPPGTGVGYVHEIPPASLRAMRAHADDVDTYARYFAVESVLADAATGMQRYRVLWFPAFNVATNLTYQYAVLASEMTADTDYPVGGLIHNPTLEAAVLKKVEERKGLTSGIAHTLYERRLLRSIERDNQGRPKNLGPMRDNSDAVVYPRQRGKTSYYS